MGGKCDYNNSVEKFEQDSQSGPAPDRRINTMANCAIVGINWGDEGKGRMVDYLTEHYDVVVRYQGGGNAGHTVVNEKGKFALHLLPSGIFRDGVVNILGNGVALDCENLLKEMETLRAAGVIITPENLKVSDRASLLLPWHRELDALEEARLADKKYGSTKQGIAPFYGDKYQKKTVQAGELLHPEHLKEHLADLLEWKNLMLQKIYGAKGYTMDELMAWVNTYCGAIKPYITDTGRFLRNAQKEGKSILFEAQLGALRDLDYGIYPYTTSSNAVAAYAPVGSGLPTAKLDEVVGVVKAYSSCVGCRSFLTPDRFTDAGVGNIANAGNYVPGKHKYYGRFNQGVVTINLPDVALSSGGNIEKFWTIFEERLELCHRALRCRHDRLKGTLSDAAPILWQYGACARLKKGEPIDKLLYDGYSTISLGYAGLYECVKYMTGKSHTDPSATPFALSIMQKMNDKCKEWKTAENIDYSLYGTPLESTTYKFAKCLQKRFGVIEGVTDKGYITNSYHVHVTEKIDAFTKLKFEAQFQHLSPGGAISYVEVPNMQQNLEAVLQVMKFIYDNIIYAELNTKSDYCQVCGWDGEIDIVEEGGKLIWRCPKCGNTDQDKMNVARRTCGYIGTQFWNQGRTQEIKERVLHL